MKFAVPQFIDVEDKIFGPLTFRQFIYLAGGGGLVFLCYKFLSIIPALLLGLPIAGFAFALAFIKVNEKPFINIVESAFTYGLSDKLYIWKHEPKKSKQTNKKTTGKTPEVAQYLPRITSSKLHDISWGLDVLDKRVQSADQN